MVAGVGIDVEVRVGAASATANRHSVQERTGQGKSRLGTSRLASGGGAGRKNKIGEGGSNGQSSGG
eukprot:5856203-Alexandrium_andersonii.AAC.1